MEKQRGLGYAAGFVAGSILIAPYIQPAWLMSLIVILFALILWRFFDTKYLSYSFCVIAILYGVTLLPLFVFCCSLAMLVAPAVEPEALHLGRRIRVTRPPERIVVEVVLAGAHGAPREVQPRLPRCDETRDIVGEGDDAPRLEVEIGQRATGSHRAGGDGIEEDARVLGHEGCAEPSLGQLARHLEAVRRERGEVHGGVRAGPRRHAQRLALPPRQRQLVHLAAIGRPLPAANHPHDVDGLAHAPHRPLEPDAVPALDDGFRQNGALVTEAGVQASGLTRSGRIPSFIESGLDTGIAIANPFTPEVSIDFYFTGQDGVNLKSGSTVIPPYSHIARFLTQEPFSSGSPFQGTFTFAASGPVAAVALRGLLNERNEFLITTLPVVDITAPATDPVVVPHFADGGGWTTEILLVNPGNNACAGTMQFYDQGSHTTPGRVIAINIDGTTDTSFSYSQGSVVTDLAGTRQVNLLFSQGTGAQLVMPNGSTQPLSTLDVRVTEYTVGESGPKAMPAELPPNVAYTYCIEFSADEAIAAGARSVTFSQPLIAYTDNFLNGGIGWDVPLASYDRVKGVWVASESGRIIKVLSITGGLADLDISGSGVAANATALAALGITDAERARLASLYAAGKSLWRMKIPHFSDPWDANWPFAPPRGRHLPQCGGPQAV